MKNFSTSIQRRKRGKRTAYFARLTNLCGIVTAARDLNS